MDLNSVAEKLTAHGFVAQVLPSTAKARAEILRLIPEHAKVGVGGSMTILSMGVHEALAEEGRTVYWHWLMPPDKREVTQELAHKADFYLTSANAITAEGELLFMDGKSNRTGTILYGPKKVIVIAGRNKLVKDAEEGLNRIKTIAAPQNARRLNLDTPCATLNRCTDCKSTQRMCNAFVRIMRPPGGREFHVLLVDDDLGY